MDKEYKATLMVYSGVPDPVWCVHPSHEKFKELKGLHDDAKKASKTHRHEHTPSSLGYKGFLVHHPDSEHADLILGKETTPLQKLLFSTMPKWAIPESLHEKIQNAIHSGAVSPTFDRATRSEKTDPVHYAPNYNPEKWNDSSEILLNNNCYNYANQKITDTMAQPGKASGKPITSPLTTENTLEGAKSDGLKVFPWSDPASVPKAPQMPNCLVALVVAEGEDYHWYRLDSGGHWSHKPGKTFVTDVDGKEHKITDPRKAANSPYGPDYKFVAFMEIFTNIIE